MLLRFDLVRHVESEVYVSSAVSSVSDASILQDLNEGLAQYLLLAVGLFHGKNVTCLFAH